MKIQTIVVVFVCLLVWTVMLLHFSDNFILHFSDNFTVFTNQLPHATTNDSKKPEETLLGGLLTVGFNEDSCISRYQKSSLYRKPSPYKPSEYLLSTLRSYETRHKRCGPGTKSYKEATEKLGGGHDDENSYFGECRYVVWIAYDGLGNQMLSLASVFLYALLTERIILADQRKDLSDLFCEPFPGTSWFLPLDFPLNYTNGYDMDYKYCYGTMKNNTNAAINSNSSIPAHLYLHNLHDAREVDKMFFCQKDQSFIDRVPWLILKANQYFAPSLWLNPTFQTKLDNLFPQRETVFHHLGRYLLHPTNQVWGMVTRYYDAHLSRADERLGIQIRMYQKNARYFNYVMDRVVACTQKENLLPRLDEPNVNISKTPKHKAVIVASLFPEYSESLKEMYWEGPSSTGEIIDINHPSGERVQQTDKKLHDQKALAEMYLLSLTDNVVTSASSTFGYVAYSLGGLKSWFLYTGVRLPAPDTPCRRSESMEPCFHRCPARGCDADSGTDAAKTVPFVRRCDDLSFRFGIKLYDT